MNSHLPEAIFGPGVITTLDVFGEGDAVGGGLAVSAAVGPVIAVAAGVAVFTAETPGAAFDMSTELQPTRATRPNETTAAIRTVALGLPTTMFAFIQLSDDPYQVHHQGLATCCRIGIGP